MTALHFPEDEAVLLGALRNRPSTASQLAKFLAIPLHETHASLIRLNERGLLVFDGTRISILSPATTTAALAQQRIATHTQRMQAQLAELAALSQQLGKNPDQSHMHALVPGDSFLQGELFRGELAGTDALESTFDSPRRSGTRHPELLGMMPNQNPPEMTPEHQQRMWGRAVHLEGSLRLMLPQSPDAIPDEMMLGHSDKNVAVRWAQSIPCWLWINTFTGEVVMPYEWGEVFPHTLIVLHHPTVMALAVALFDTCWEAATPALASPAALPWESILQMMRTGLSLNDAAERLQITPRTARRRLEKGMRTYGVNGLFALAAAWAADHEDGVIPFAARRSSQL